jgi:hypothetical protein
MLARGFHVEFLGLSDYFFRKTGWNPLDSNAGATETPSDDAGTSADAEADSGDAG